MAASLKAPSDFSKPLPVPPPPQKSKSSLITPEALQSSGSQRPLKAKQRQDPIPSRIDDRHENADRLDSNCAWKSVTQHQGMGGLPQHQLHTAIQGTNSGPLVLQDMRAQGDMFHGYPQYVPQVPPVYHHPPSVPVPPPSPSTHPDSSLVHLKHTTEVISRQATEIAQLRSEAERQEAGYKNELAGLRAEMLELKGKARAEVERLERELSDEKESIVRENLQKDERHETDLSAIRRELEDHARQADEREAGLKERLQQLEQALARANEEVEDLEMKYENDMRKKIEALTVTNAQLAQMRVYIQDSRPSTKTVAEWEAEKTSMEKKIRGATSGWLKGTQKVDSRMEDSSNPDVDMVQYEDFEDTVDTLKATEQLVNVRLTSTQQLLALQESEILQSQTVIQTPDETATSILTKWREKVYALLVQQKSQEIVTADEHRKHTTKLSDLQNQLERCQFTAQKLEHTLLDKEAELDLVKQMSQARLQELQKTEEIAGQLDQQLTSWEDAGGTVKRMLINNQEFMQSKTVKIQEAMKKLSAADQRISFATSRIALLKDLFAHKESSWRVAISKASGAPSLCQCQDAEVQTDDSDESALQWDGIQVELDQVREERDGLAAELREQAQHTERRVNDAIQSLDEQNIALKEKIADTERQLHQESKTVSNLQEELTHRDKEIQDLTEANAVLRVDQSRIEANAESASSEKCVALEEKYQSEMKEMEMRLNEARREHAKAVVTYRQMERQLNREKERAADTLQGREDYLNGEVERLKNKLREAERDKNLLMTTLRQEGLISKYKSYRKAARDMEVDSTEEDIPPAIMGAPLGANERSASLEVDERGAAQRPEGGAVQGPSNPESLNAMLKDVQSLAAQVLSDDLGEVT